MPSHPPPNHHYATRANNIPLMPPLSQPSRRWLSFWPRPAPRVHTHPYSLGLQWGDEDAISELDLGEPRIPLEDATTHVVRRKGGETVVFPWEDWWAVGDVWEAEALKRARARRQRRARMGGMSRAARRRAWKRGPGRRRSRGEDGRFC